MECKQYFQNNRNTFRNSLSCVCSRIFQERDFVANLIDTLNISPSTINVGFTVYSSDIEHHTPLTPFRPKIVLKAMAKSVQRPTGIATNTARGIAKIRETFRAQPRERANAPKIMIVITDGSSENPAETIDQARIAKSEGIRIIAVGVGNNIFEEELLQIASNQQKYYKTPNFNTLKNIESDIRQMICSGKRSYKIKTINFVKFNKNVQTCL